MQESKEQTMCHRIQHKPSACRIETKLIKPEGLAIRVQKQISEYQTLIYEGKVTEEDMKENAQIGKSFSSFEEVVDWMRDQEQINIDLDKMVIELLSKPLTKKLKHILLCTIPLKHIETVRNKFDEKLMEETIMSCNSKDQIENDKIKEMLENLAYAVKELLQERNKSLSIVENVQDQLKRFQDKSIQQSENSQFYKVQIQKLKAEIAIDREGALASDAQLRQFCKDSYVKLEKQIALKITQEVEKLVTKKELTDEIEKLQAFREMRRATVQMEKLVQKTETLRTELNCIKGSKHIQKKTQQKLQQKQQQAQVQKLVQVNKSKPASQIALKVDHGQWVDQKCLHFDKLLIKQNKIQLKQKNGGAHILGKQVLTEGQNNFTVSFQNIDTNYAWVGVVDQSNRNEKQVNKSQNWICYCAKGSMCNKQKWAMGGAGFVQDEVITVRIDFNKGVVEWVIGGQTRREVENEKLIDKSIKWVPYIYIGLKTAVSIEG